MLFQINLLKSMTTVSPKDCKVSRELVVRQRAYTLMECQLIEAAKASLRAEIYDNAVFLCERLVAEANNEETRLLLAECYIGTPLAQCRRE